MGCASSGPQNGLMTAAADAVGDTVKAGEHMVTEFGEHAKENISTGVDHMKEAVNTAVTSVEHGLSTAVGTIGESLGISHPTPSAPPDQMSTTETLILNETDDTTMMDKVLEETNEIEASLDTAISDIKNDMDDEVTEMMNDVNMEMDNYKANVESTIIKLGDEVDETIQLIQINGEREDEGMEKTDESEKGEDKKEDEPCSPPTVWERAHDAIFRISISRNSNDIADDFIKILQRNAEKEKENDFTINSDAIDNTEHYIT